MTTRTHPGRSITRGCEVRNDVAAGGMRGITVGPADAGITDDERGTVAEMNVFWRQLTIAVEVGL